ncbi:hypothetical protein EII34_14440 [Arachnia propionica]|uniref:Uncharacterized protein n=1 Tax=Arachnia propionica TaxID=1750 RepID=A0A3P1T3I6_9ACTN|nr:hypothetical protein [Arachnia propionica]RRD03386.1 hypothetical protein EII34_14440 [Arachnia propionica]
MQHTVKSLCRMARRAPSATRLVADLAALGDDERTALRDLWRDGGRADCPRTALLVVLEDDPALVLGPLHHQVVAELLADDQARRALVDHWAGRGRAWAESLIAATSPVDVELCGPLLDDLADAVGLPRRDDIPSWLGRLQPRGVDENQWHHAVAETLARLPEEDRVRAREVLKHVTTTPGHSTWRHLLGGLGAILTLEDGGTAREAAEALGFARWGYPPPRGQLLAAVTARGPDFAAEFVDLASRGEAARLHLGDLCALITRFDLPLPTAAGFWAAWANSLTTPAPNLAQWVIAASRVPGTFSGRPLFTGPAVIAAEERRDVALALLEPVRRGERSEAQRSVVHWLKELDLTDELPGLRTELLTVLAGADDAVVRLAVDHILPHLDGDQLTHLAQEVLPRRAVTPRRKVLKALSRLDAVPVEVLETVRALAEDKNTTCRDLARDLLVLWGDGVEESGPVGLWRDPAGTPAEPLTWTRPDEPEWNAWAQLRGLDPALDPLDLVGGGWPTGPDNRVQGPDRLTPVWLERWLAAVVAVAHVDGLPELHRLTRTSTVDEVAELFGSPDHSDHGRPDALARLTTLRLHETLGRLGEIPCLLSTPSHERMLLGWKEFAERVARHREAGVAVGSVDVAVALGRLDPTTAPDDLSHLDSPILGRQRSLVEVLEAWRQPQPPAEIRTHPPARKPVIGWTRGSRPQLEIVGEPAPGHGMLGISSAWSQAYQPKRLSRPWTLQLLPFATSRPSVQLLQLVDNGAPPREPLLAVLQVAAQLDPLLCFAALATVSRIPRPDAVADALLTAWDEGRLAPSDLARAWSSPLAEHWTPNPSRVAAMAAMIADAGGLALVWPLLVAVAESLTGAARRPASTGSVLETLLSYLPEVPGAALLPNIAALAASKGTTKAHRVAREVVASR